MFSNFYRLDLHNKKTHVTLANLRWNIYKNWIENQTSLDLVMVIEVQKEKDKNEKEKEKEKLMYLGPNMNVSPLALCWSQYSVMQHKVFCLLYIKSAYLLIS